MTRRTLYVDGQVFQSAAWDRGMGKYSLHLLKSLLASKQSHYEKVIIVFTKNMELSDAARMALNSASELVSLEFLDLSVPRDFNPENLKKMRRRNREVLDRYVSEGENSDADFLILSLFIDQVSSVFPSMNVNRILLFYDLIPLQYANRYEKLHTYDNYLVRFETVLEADMILTISQTVADDLVTHLGVSVSKIANIDGAPIERVLSSDYESGITIPGRYLLMPSGDDLRKNNTRAVRAFEEYRTRYTDGKVWLVLTSFFQDVTKDELSRISPNVIFTGNVSEEDLHLLYTNSDALLFVSEYEGLGLPILEAVEADKPVICSSLSVFGEMSTTAFYYTDETDIESIVLAIDRGMQRDGFEAKRVEYPSILKRYTWAHTAQKAVKAMASNRSKKQVIKKPRLAVLAPTPSGYSAIGKVVQQQHPSISEYFEVDYYLEEGKSVDDSFRPNYLRYVAKTYKARDFNAKAYAKYDAVVYHIGNSEYHLDTIKSALYLPGIVVLHDAQLKGLYDVLQDRGYISKERLNAEVKLDELLNQPAGTMLSSLLTRQLGILAHSSYAAKVINNLVEDQGVLVEKANLPTGTPEMKPIKTAKAFTIAFAGIIHRAKGIDLVSKLAMQPALHDAAIHVFGVPLMGPEELARLEQTPSVTVTKSPTDFEFESLLSKSDVLIGYRTEYKGETSLTVVEAMRFGVVPIVRNIGWFSELSSRFAEKVDDEDELINAVVALKESTELLSKKSEQARQDAVNHRSYEQYAEAISRLVASSTSVNKKDDLNSEVQSLLKARKSLKRLIALIQKSM